ncbi:MAG TPA: hypothetical protein VLT88_04705, partial [Desulfosarcina sp.]|nr:hypothetical protein [Desulfosarcina sp.]
LDGFTTRVKTGLGQLYVTVTEYQGKPFEVFATIGKSGRSTTAKTEAIGRLVSLAFRSGVTVDKVVEQLKGIGGEHPIFQNGGLVLSIPDAISRVLERRYLKDGGVKKKNNSLMGETCPECSQTVSFEEGCMTCHFCGFTKCGCVGGGKGAFWPGPASSRGRNLFRLLGGFSRMKAMAFSSPGGAGTGPGRPKDNRPSPSRPHRPRKPGRWS